jgi:UDP-N-acetylmuramate: L-alanyl-gamma-D-glutamyl-meso-diaminopimelate ligase
MHYRARTALLTSVEFDHADIYRDMAHYESAYDKFVATIPEDGFLAVAASYPNAVEIARRSSRAYVATYAAHGEADYVAEDLRFGPEGARFVIREPRGAAGEFLLPMSGHHNVENAVGVYAAARALGLSADQIRGGFASFDGVKRRQEIRGEIGGVLVIDDFAHHPTAIGVTLEALAERYAGRRILAAFEPRSNTARRSVFQHGFAAAFDRAARVYLGAVYFKENDPLPPADRLDTDTLASAIAARGPAARSFATTDAILERIVADARPGDIVVCMSNGPFDGLPQRLLTALI